MTAPGFRHLSRTGVTAIVGQTVSADLTLSAGGDQQTVTVNGDAPLLQAETSNIQTNIPGRTVVAMPLNYAQFCAAFDAGAGRGAAAGDAAAAHRRRAAAHE